MTKINNIVIIPCLLLIVCFSSCSVNLGYVFKKLTIDQTIGRVDLGKTLIKLETPNFYLLIRENRTTYCPGYKTSIYDSSDTISCKNPRLSTVMQLLLKDKKIITHKVNMKYDPKIDLIFVQKTNLSKQESIDTIIWYLQSAFNFKVKQEDIKYDLTVSDSVKYKKLWVNKKGNGSIASSKSKIVFKNNDLFTIVDMLNDQYNMFIDYNKREKHKFSMILPRNNVDSLKIYLSNKCGIELISSTSDDKYVRLEFKK